MGFPVAFWRLPYVADFGFHCPVCNCAHARIWTCAGLPAGRRKSGFYRALAVGRRGLRGTAAAPRRDAVEHRGGTAGERGAGRSAVHFLAVQSFPALAGHASGLERIFADDLGHESRHIDFQYAPDLSAGWRANCSVAAVVFCRAGEQFDGGIGAGFCGSADRDPFGVDGAFTVDGSYCGICGVELLGWVSAVAVAIAIGEGAEAGGVSLPGVQGIAAGWRVLAMQPVRAEV